METKEAIAAVIKEDGIDSAIAWIAGVVDEKHNRIEQLETALRKIVDGPRDADKSYAELFVEVCMEARAVLGEKKDG